jgi:hypothetical protein
MRVSECGHQCEGSTAFSDREGVASFAEKIIACQVRVQQSLEWPQNFLFHLIHSLILFIIKLR